MSVKRINAVLKEAVDGLKARGTAKAPEMVVIRIMPATATRGPRYLIEGYGDREFIRMNSNSYLGITRAPELIEAEEAAAKQFGTGPGAEPGSVWPHHGGSTERRGPQSGRHGRRQRQLGRLERRHTRSTARAGG